jgi:hypothetical protein
MALEQKTMTAPRAIIKVDGKAIGYIRNIRISETINRGMVMGLGRLTKRELPALSINCTWNCDFYLIDLNRTGVPGLNKRNVASTDQYKDTLTLFERPVDIYIYKKEMESEEDGVVTAVKDSEFAILKNVYINTESFDITENQISGQNQSGEYTEPVIFPV